MHEDRVKGKWLSRLPFVKELFEHRIEAIEHHDVEVPEPEQAVKELKKGIRGKSVNSRYVANFLDVFKEKRKKLRRRIRLEDNKAFRKQLRKELRALEKAIASVEQATSGARPSGDPGISAHKSRR